MTTLTAQITRKLTLPGIYSASGVEVVGKRIFVIGDDSATLFILNQDWAIEHSIDVFKPEFIENARIPKKYKPDFEGMTLLRDEQEVKLLIVGSGSTELRQDAYLISTQKPYVIEKYSLAALYEQVRTYTQIVGSNKLNIEGIAASDDHLFLQQRGNISGNNALISYNLSAFLDYLKGKTPQPPIHTIQIYPLPSIKGIPAGFSGITTIPNTPLLLFTASVEDTPNEIDDGEMLGSFIGLIHPNQSREVLASVLVTENKVAYPGKIESIAVWQQTSPTSLMAVAVTDTDGGDSEILEIAIQW